jgi:hypothetical protein
MEQITNYIFIFADSEDYELDRKILPCVDDKEAQEVANQLLAECMLGDCEDVYFL